MTDPSVSDDEGIADRMAVPEAPARAVALALPARLDASVNRTFGDLIWN